jgi:hypothetical protein
MRLDLPHASSVHANRVTPPEAPRRLRRRLLGYVVAALALVGLAGGAYVLYGRLSSPVIKRLEPMVGEPGGIVRIYGKNFGAERGDSYVEIDRVTPTDSSYISWNEEMVAVRLPAAVDSGILRLVTRHGSSNPKLFMNRSRLPQRAEGRLAGRTGPYLASISPEAGTVGSLVTIVGLDFGANRESGAVYFAWTAEEGSRASQDLPAVAAAPESDLGYELWSDKEIRVRIPDGAVSGPVYLTSAKGRSNTAFLKVGEAPGSKRFLDRRSYSLNQAISITKVKASGPNELYLWAPQPATSASQMMVRVLGQSPEPMIPKFRGTSLFRFKDLSSGVDLGVSQSWLVQVFAVETEVDVLRVVAKPRNPPAIMSVYLGADEYVPSTDPVIQSLARKIAGGEPNPWRAARLIWDWLMKNLAWTSSHDHDKVVDALGDKSADSYSYAILACAFLRASGVPALPIAGYLVDPNRAAIRHYWVEIYLYGLGWVPLDPVLGSGARPGGMDASFGDRSAYFGNNDNRHIAFSRGSSTIAPMAPNGKRVGKERRWSFQSFYEEAAGALEAYSSFWGDVEVTGVY